MQHGWCGDSEAHCDGETLPPTEVPTSSPSASVAPTAFPTTGAPTPSPTRRTPATPGHGSFCGPRLVGGFDEAKANCSKETECGFSQEATAYGFTGNDCPKNYMCFPDIVCEAPTSTPSGAPVMPSGSPSLSEAPTYKGQTQPPTPTPPPTRDPSASPSDVPSGSPTTSSPTSDPTKARLPTLPPANLQNTITVRGSYCGRTFELALGGCNPSTSCEYDEDCDGGGGGEGGCFPNISCTYHAAEDDKFLGSAAPPGDDAGEEGGAASDGATDDLYGREFESTTDLGEEYTPEDSAGGCFRSSRGGALASAALLFVLSRAGGLLLSD